MALDHLPAALREGGSSSLFRRYLEAGGTVVWPSLFPGFWTRDPETGASGDFDQIRYDGPVPLIDVDATAATFDYIGAYATDEGAALGLPPRYWPSAARNSLVAGLEGLILQTRLLWLGVAGLVYAAASARFRMTALETRRARHAAGSSATATSAPAASEARFGGRFSRSSWAIYGD